MGEQTTLDKTLRVAEDVLDVLRARQLDAVVIGAVALAIHGYPRATQDLDLAVAVDPTVLHELAARLRSKGYEVVVRDPDPQDPLGGVMDVCADGSDPVQVVNFQNPPGGGFPRLVHDAIASATELIPNRPLRVVDPIHLIAFKLYAGGSKSKLDILELLDRNPSLDRSKLRTLCDDYRLSAELEQVLALEASE